MQRILAVGYTPTWHVLVKKAVEGIAELLIKTTRVDALTAQCEEKFELYILGNYLCEEPNSAIYLIEQARIDKDRTPTIVFTQHIDSETEAMLNSSRVTVIRSDEDNSVEILRQAIVNQLVSA